MSPLVVLLAVCAAGCSSMQQTSYPSPDDAVSALVAAARSHDQAALKRVLGSGSGELISSGDDVADRYHLDKFVADYDEKHRLESAPDGSVTLVVGKDDWPMPIPIVKGDSAAKWYFDTDAGMDEMINRRIGANELSAVQVCLAIVDAQRDYVMLNPDNDALPDYAQKIISDPGTKNGLYWPTSPGEPLSPLGELVAEASDEGYGGNRGSRGERRPYHGYLYKLLTRQGPHAADGEREYIVNGNLIGGFAVVAWPADYGNSGIMTFIVNQDGVVYQRDLGENTHRTAEAMTSFDPGPDWKRVE
jgi:hypothetical protein